MGTYGLSAEEREAFNRLIMPVDTSINMDKIILSEENKAKVERIVTERKFADIIRKHGLHPINKILMYGAPGTGKTLLSKALAGHFGCDMMYVDVAQALSNGEVATNIKEVFMIAEKLDKPLIFFDECDSVAWKRDSITSEGGDARRATNAIFQHLDQMSDRVVFIAATNMQHQLDDAFKRRFNMKMGFDKPSGDKLREYIDRFMVKGFKLVDDLDSDYETMVKKRANQYNLLNFSEIQSMVEECVKQAIFIESNEVSLTKIFRLVYQSFCV